MILPQDHVRINVNYLIPRKELATFSKTIEMWSEYTQEDENQSNSKVKRKLLILECVSSEKWSKAHSIYVIARRKGYPCNVKANKKWFIDDVMELISGGYLIGRGKEDKLEITRDDGKILMLDIMAETEGKQNDHSNTQRRK